MTDVAPARVWTYRLELVRSGGAPSCIEEVTVVVPPLACDVSLLCEQIRASFVGEVLAGSVALAWSSSMESAAMGYRLVRFDRHDPTGAKELAVVAATGGCGQVRMRGFRDTPPVGERVYRLEVFDNSGALRCRVAMLPASGRRADEP